MRALDDSGVHELNIQHDGHLVAHENATGLRVAFQVRGETYIPAGSFGACWRFLAACLRTSLIGFLRKEFPMMPQDRKPPRSRLWEEIVQDAYREKDPERLAKLAEEVRHALKVAGFDVLLQPPAA